MSVNADRIKETVSIVEASERYGVEPNKRGYALCPFHEEGMESLKLYPETNTFYCFGCGAGGDVITFVERLFQLKYGQALVRLSNDFGVSLEDGRLDSRRAAVISRERAARKIAKENARKDYMRQIGLFSALWEIRSSCAPKEPDEPLDPAFVQALHELDYLDYWLEEHPWK